jgi:hypothetical protein
MKNESFAGGYSKVSESINDKACIKNQTKKGKYMTHKTLTVEAAALKLKDIVSPNYEWPNNPEPGYELEFILHPDGSIILDFLNEERAMFWSEAASEFMNTPLKNNGEPITWKDLKSVGISYMS